MFVSKEQIAKAREMDLLTYLQYYEPEELVHFSGNTYTTRTHDSLKISNGKWFWWSQGFGGQNALDYLIKVRQIPFPEAVSMILNEPTVVMMPRIVTGKKNKEHSKIEFKLPARHANNRRVFSYLKSRGISAEIINACIEQNLLYEEEQYHNCVFIGYKGDIAKYAALRGTLSQSTFVGEVGGSDKRFSFSFPREQNQNIVNEVYVFESAIDVLSYLTLVDMEQTADWHSISCLSLGGGISNLKEIPISLEHYLKTHTAVKKLILCLDQDETGRTAAKLITERLTEYEVVDLPPQDGKDYNELLQMKLGIHGAVTMRGKKARSEDLSFGG